MGYLSYSISMNQMKERYYKLKNPAVTFYCPLCRAERAFEHHAHLGPKHYLQIGMASLLFMTLSYSVMEWRIFIWPFIVWSFAEAALKIVFRRQVPCPHCGFDATWYKRDIKVARTLVKQFWEEKNDKNNQISFKKSVKSIT